MMTLKRNAKAAAAVASASVLFLLGSLAPAAANATEQVGQEDIVELAAALQVPPAAESAISQAYASLSDAEQAVVLSTLQTDPSSLIEWSSSTPSDLVTATTQPQMATKSSAFAAKATAVVAKDSKTAYLLGIPIGNWVIEYKYYATSTAVTGNIDCQGWFSGIGVSDSVEESSYVANGRGTCSARHNMSFVFMGSPISWNKLHTFTTKAGNPRSLSGSITNV